MSEEVQRRCRHCGGQIIRPVGTGALRDGYFCSLDCFTAHNARYLEIKAKWARERSSN